MKSRSGRGRKTGVAVLLALVAGAALGAQLSDADDLVTAGVATPPPRNGPVVVRVGAALKANPIPSGFLGLSIEYTALLPYAGTDAPTSVLVQLIRQLDPGQSPVLRFGGDTTDWSWVPVPGMAQPPGVHYVITPQWLDAAAGLVHALNARVIFGVNLQANRPVVAATEATAFVDAVGLASVEALEVGNEPEAYGFRGWYHTPAGIPVLSRRPSYDIRSYAREFKRFARVLPNLPLAGPATGSNGWMAGLPRLLSAAPRLRVVTVHRYPLNHCAAPGTEHHPSLARLAGSDLVARLGAVRGRGGLDGSRARCGAQGRRAQLRRLSRPGRRQRHVRVGAVGARRAVQPGRRRRRRRQHPHAPGVGLPPVRARAQRRRRPVGRRSPVLRDVDVRPGRATGITPALDLGLAA